MNCTYYKENCTNLYMDCKQKSLSLARLGKALYAWSRLSLRLKDFIFSFTQEKQVNRSSYRIRICCQNCYYKGERSSSLLSLLGVIPFTSSTAKKNSLSSYIPSRTKPRHSLPQRELTCSKSRPAPIYVRTGHGKPIQWYDRRWASTFCLDLNSIDLYEWSW